MPGHFKTLIVDDDPLTVRILEEYVGRTDYLNLVGSCKDAIEAANLLQKKDVDLLFLDVELPGMTGIELIESLSEIPQVILVSGKDIYAASGFDHDVSDYLVKPVDYARFLKAVNKATDSIEKKSPDKPANDRLFVKSDTQLVAIKVEEIAFIEALADYVRIHTPEKRYTVYSSLKGIESKLPDSTFMRVHRSYVINIQKIDSIEGNTVTIGDNLIPVGVTYQKTLLTRLNLL